MLTNPQEEISRATLVKNNPYICPSIKSFQLPLNDIRILDILKRQELTLPEIHKNKEVFDPLLINQVNKNLPEHHPNRQSPAMECGRPLFSEIKWRKRKMNIHKRRKYQKKMFFKFKTRKQNKEKRYTALCEMLAQIHAKKTEAFEPIRFINRELEKAKFYGYKCSNVYDKYREIVNVEIKSFDEKFFRRFDDPNKPLHVKYAEELAEENMKKEKK